MPCRNFLKNVRVNPIFLKYFYAAIAGLTIAKNIFSWREKSTE